MFLQVPYADLKARFSSQVAVIERLIRKSRSKERAAPFVDFQWGFSWSETIRGYSMGDILLGKPEREAQALREMSEDEEVANYGRRCLCVVRFLAGHGFRYTVS